MTIRDIFFVNQAVNDLAVLPDGKFAVAMESGYVVVSDFHEHNEIKFSDNPIHYMSALLDGKLVIYDSGFVKIFNEDGTLVKVFKSRWGFQVLPDGELVLLQTKRGGISIYK